MERSESLGEDFYEVTRQDPGYLSDLRMKRSSDPREFFEANALLILRAFPNSLSDLPEVDECASSLAARLSLAVTFKSKANFQQFVSDHLGSDAHLVHQALCWYVNYVGSWADAELIARAVWDFRFDVLDTEDGARLLTDCGTVFGVSLQDIRYRELYELALERWDIPYEIFLTHLRSATIEIKRIGNPQAAESSLSRAFHAARGLVEYGHSGEDAAFSEALVLNLSALADVRGGRTGEARERINRALSLMAVSPNSHLGMPARIANRYRVTVLENAAILDLVQEDWEAAAVGFERAVRFAEDLDPGSVSEALSLWGYVLLRLDRLALAQEVLGQAEATLRREVSPSRLRQVRKLLAICATRTGVPSQARRWLAYLS